MRTNIKSNRILAVMLVMVMALSLGGVMGTNEVYGASGFTISGQTCPTAMLQGDYFTLKGKITSANKLTTASVGVTDLNDKWVRGFCTSENPNSKTFDIASVDAAIPFNKLPAGTYYYTVWVRDEAGAGKKLIRQKFTVSSLSIVNANPPTTIIQGQSYAIKGVVESTFKLSNVTVVVLDKNNKEVSYCKGSGSLGVYRYSIGYYLDKYVQLDKLPAGTYTYRVTAKDVVGKSRTLINQKLTVKAADAAPTPGTIAIMGASTPGTLTTGSHFAIAGKITSTYNLTSVRVGMTDINGNWKSGYNVTKTINAKSYDIKALDSLVYSEKLPAGTYYYKVWAQDEKKQAKVLSNKQFVVKAPAPPASAMVITGTTIPAKLYKGKTFTLKGKITDSVNLTQVRVGIADSKGAWKSGFNVTVTPKAKTYDINVIDENIAFDKLPAGTYYYKVWAKDTNGQTKDLINSKFTVSEFTAKGQTTPGDTITMGTYFSLKGAITSPFKMTSIQVGIMNMSSKWLSGFNVIVKPNATTFDIHTVDEKIEFNKLAEGSYYYRVNVTDATGLSKTVINKKFTVKKSTVNVNKSVKMTSNSYGYYLQYPAATIKAIGAQPYSGPCGCYAMAFSRTVMDGFFSTGGYTARSGYNAYYWRIINQYGLGTSLAYWNRAGGTNTYYSTAKSMYKKAFAEVQSGRPCIINLWNPPCASNHYVTVIGYKKGTTADNVTLSSFIILDPAYGTFRYLQGSEYTHHPSYWQCIYFK